MPLLGSFCLLFALALAAYCFVVGVIAAVRKDAVGYRLAETARRAGMASFAAVLVAAGALVYAALTDDFSVAYILHHSNRALPGPYKFAVLWSGQEGSVLFWALLLSAYGFVLRLRHKVDQRLVAMASMVLAAIQVFFLILANFAANPFGMMDRVAADGSGLNPLLQYPEMVIHPPMLYLGYVGVSVPFAFALAALIMRYPGEKWIHITRRWTMVAWLFLTFGISLGAHWAYAVLGWGGYWGWDPVENASLLPWLSTTAFLHSVMMQEKRGMMKIWNVWLIFITFMLSILGTFLTRSGVVSSVHSFAQSSIGNWFSGFLAIIFAFCMSSLVTATVASEFIRGGIVWKNKLQTNIFAGMYQLSRRNMRRYGGYVVHFGVVLVVIGLAGAAFNRDQEQEMATGDKIEIGRYTLVSKAYTEDDNANYGSRAALLDVYRNGKFLTQLNPEERRFKASGGQPVHIVANHSTLREDLYVTFQGLNDQTGHPIIKAIINPLVNWIWIGVLVIVLGTGMALVPNATPMSVPVPSTVAVASMEKQGMQPAGVGK